jgi:hypothetical protein
LRGCFVLAGLAACGRFGFDPSANRAVDASADTASDSVAGPRCDVAKPYGAPVLLPGLSSASLEIGVELTADMLDGVMWSSRSGTDRIYEVTRASTVDDFGMPQLVPNLGSVSGVPDRDPVLTGDGLTLVFTSTRTGTWDLFLTTRPSRTQPFAPPVAITELATAGDDWGPFISSDGLGLYYILGADIAYSRRANTASAWSAPGTILANVSSASSEFEPAVTSDELTMFWASDRPDGGMGGLDIWKATRSTKADPFGTPTPVTELNSTGDDLPSWVSDDLCQMFMTRTNGAASWDLYVATKPL